MQAAKTLGALALAASLATSSAHAGIWAESGSGTGAGQLPLTAESTIADTRLTGITGSLNYDNDLEIWNVDLFEIMIFDPVLFSARVVELPGEITDAMLFLFDAGGKGVYANDDTTGTTGLFPVLPAGNASGPAAAGKYFLGIGWGYSDALDGSPASMFDLVSTLSTDLLTPISAGVLSDWNLSGLTAAAGASGDLAPYTIEVTGTTPEPGTLALLALAAFALVGSRRLTGTQ